MRNQVESISCENKLLKDTTKDLEKEKEMFKIRVNDLLVENEQLTKITYSSIDCDKVIHSTAFDANEIVMNNNGEKFFFKKFINSLKDSKRFVKRKIKI